MNDSPKTAGDYKIALVINEYSSGGSFRPLINDELYNQVNIFQKETGYNIAISFTRSREHIPKVMGSLQKSGHNLFIAVGGDGTINDIIQHMNQGNILVPIPAGNANDFSARLHITHWRDTIKAVKGIIDGSLNVIGIDLGEIVFYNAEGKQLRRRFINNCGFGVTADTVRRVEGKVLKMYVWNGLVSLLTAKPFNLTYYSTIMKKNIHISCVGVEMLLCKKVGRHANFAPYKHENDGTLHFSVFKNLPFFKRLGLIMLINFGKFMVKSGFVEYFHDRPDNPDISDTNMFGLTIRGISSVWGMIHDRVLLHTDGNLVPEFAEIAQKDCRVNVLPKFIRTVAPL